MNLKKWVFPASLYVVAFVIIFTVSIFHGLVKERQQLNPDQVGVPAEVVNQASPVTTQKPTNTQGSTRAQEPSKVGGQLAQAGQVQHRAQASDFKSPVQGEVLRAAGDYYSSTLQAYVYHAGVDYAEPEGVVIRAGHGGKVVYAGKDVLLGERVTLDCGDGWQVTYGGLQHLIVKDGQSVSQGQAIGQVAFDSGNEGQGRPQLHYEVWHNGEPATP